MTQTYGELDYLHDGELLDSTYAADDRGDRQVIMDIRVHKDAGKSDWDGRVLRIVLSGVYLFSCQRWGYVAGAEYVDAWYERVSETTESELERHQALGLRVPKLKFTVTISTGSWLEIVCESVSVEVTT